MTITPEELQEISEHAHQIAAILYRHTLKSELKDLESLEKTVRQQVIEHVSPKIALFLSVK